MFPLIKLFIGGGEILKATKKLFTIALAAFLTMFSASGVFSPRVAQAYPSIPQVEFVSAPVTEYTVGDRVQFKIFAPNYSGRVEYRVVLWNDSTKSYGDLWHPGNGYTTCYYTKWQPKGNDVFTLGWPIFQPGSYRITVYAKRVGIQPVKAYLKGYNCDSYMESVAFYVSPAGPDVQTILPLEDVVVNQGGTPLLPKTVKAVMDDGTQRDLKVNWNPVNTTKMGIVVAEGNVEGTNKKASVRIIVNQGILTPYSVNAISNYAINVSFTSSIDFVPVAGRFSVKTPAATTMKVHSVIMSSEQKSLQLVTDYMAPGNWYILVIDGKEYGFNVPYSGGNPPAANTVSVTAYDKVVTIGDSIYANVTTNPANVTLYFSSGNTSIVSVDRYTGKITGISAGATTITVTASKEGYNTGWAAFTVNVLSNNQFVYAPTASPEPGVVLDGTSVTLRTNTEGASIYYTLDGTTPTLSSYRYTGSIVIHANTTIKAVAVKQGVGTSNISTFVYTLKTTGISTNLWLRDRSFSSIYYYYIDWSGPFEITLDKTVGGRRIIKLHNVTARNINSDTVKNYGNIIFTETGVNSSRYTTGTWDGTFDLDEYWNGYEHCIRLTNNSNVELKMLNPLIDYPDYIREWFE